MAPTVVFAHGGDSGEGYGDGAGDLNNVYAVQRESACEVGGNCDPTTICQSGQFTAPEDVERSGLVCGAQRSLTP